MTRASASSAFFASLSLAGALLGVVSLWPAPAFAEEQFPAIIARDAGLGCTPTCTLCHTTNPGVAGTWVGKEFGKFIGTHGAMRGDPNSVTTAFNAYKTAAATDATVAAGLTALQSGIDPDTGYGLCGPTYGCGAHVARQAPSSELGAPLWLVGAVVAGAVLRRRRKPRGS